MVSLDLMKNIVEQANKNLSLKNELKGSPRIFQFKLEGEKPFYVAIKEDGSLELIEGEHSTPTATLSAKDEVMKDIIEGRLDGVQAFFRGQLKISGDVFAVQKLNTILSRLRK